MAETKIEWADYTFNPWVGCVKVSPGCENCYAEADFDKRRGYARWGANGTRVMTSEANWKKPQAWNRKAEKEGVRYRVFCASLADVFEDWEGVIYDYKGNVLTNSDAPITMNDVRRNLFQLIDATPRLDWLILTKRPENIQQMWMVDANGELTSYRENVWLLISVENQEQADKRIPDLLKCRDLSPVLGLSCEPLLGEIDLSHTLGTLLPSEHEYPHNFCEQGIDWVIAGGESGRNARPMHPDWARSILNQCQRAIVPFFFKQWGTWLPGSYGKPPAKCCVLFNDGQMICPDSTESRTELSRRNDRRWDEFHPYTISRANKNDDRLLNNQEWNQFPKVSIQKGESDE